MLTLPYFRQILEQYPQEYSATVKEFALGSKMFRFNSAPALMGVINLSPDSWYRESVCLSTEQAVARGKILAAQGAAIIDVGAESTLARAERIDPHAQQKRLLPVIKELTDAGMLVSVETYDRRTAHASLKAGARVLNVTGTAGTRQIFQLAREYAAAVIVCYVQGRNVREVSEFDLIGDPIAMMTEHFKREIDTAAEAGLDKLFIDPGLGFYYRNLADSTKRIQHQANIFLQSFRLRSLGFPVCQALPHAFEFFGEEVRTAEAFFAVLAALGKTDLYRTHEIPRVRAVIETLAVLGEGPGI